MSLDSVLFSLTCALFGLAVLYISDKGTASSKLVKE